MLTHIISVAGTEKGNAHTWLWRGEDQGWSQEFFLPWAIK